MKNISVAVLISGGGTTLANLIQHQQMGELPADLKLVISSNPKAKGLQFAQQASIPSQIISRKNYDDAQQHSQAIFEPCREQQIDLVVMGGYLEHLLIPSDFENRVVNVHPSLIPAFCGRGMYGQRVHAAVLEHGVKVTGCTIHFVDNEYDHGPIIAQRSCSVLRLDKPETLARRVFELECQLYPEVISAIARGKVEVTGRHVSVFEIL
ncbi:MAG: phosphoribosylglycinamide formyltransferase [Pirellulaceae bacterium]